MGALGTIKKDMENFSNKIPGNINIYKLQKITLLSTAHLLRWVLSIIIIIIIYKCCLRLDYSRNQNKTKQKKHTEKKKDIKGKKKEHKIALSLGSPNSYFYNKRCNMLLWSLYLSFSWLYKVAAFCQCQCHPSCPRTWSIHRRKRQGSSRRDLQISHSNFYSFRWSSSDIFLFYALHCC